MRNLAAAKAVEARVDDVNETLGRLGITEEILVVSRPCADGSVRVAMSHTMSEISALGVIARSLVEGRAGLWDDDGDGLTASVGRVGTSTSSWRERAEALRTQSVARRLVRRHEVWREASEHFGSPGQWLELKRSQRARRRFERGYD
ncbi:hypothetical protein [Williamsia sp.]|uniref:hypothetical protein n=1 Tax=Williamsia sp. TaxID=1872085 RepID=UPI001A31E47C|nr:hypothetical protein [Williamsia sp.]MBJ7289405.1 hypothetical protein [Williamsia sp.]